MTVIFLLIIEHGLNLCMECVLIESGVWFWGFLQFHQLVHSNILIIVDILIVGLLIIIIGHLFWHRIHIWRQLHHVVRLHNILLLATVIISVDVVQALVKVLRSRHHRCHFTLLGHYLFVLEHYLWHVHFVRCHILRAVFWVSYAHLLLILEHLVVWVHHLHLLLPVLHIWNRRFVRVLIIKSRLNERISDAWIQLWVWNYVWLLLHIPRRRWILLGDKLHVCELALKLRHVFRSN